jgi:hypothetical protein
MPTKRKKSTQKDVNGHEITPRAKRNRPLGTISLSPEAWAQLDEIVEKTGASRSAAIETMIRTTRDDLRARGRK